MSRMVSLSPERPVAIRRETVMHPITDQYLATARMNDRVREASSRTSPVRRRSRLVRIPRISFVSWRGGEARRRPTPRSA